MNCNGEVIHQSFIETASELSEDLADAIRQVGILEFQPNNSEPLAHHLCKSVAQQQLSIKAADTIWNRVMEAANDLPLTEFCRDENARQLHSCGLSKAKVRSICEISECARQGNLKADDLKSLNYKKRTKRLTSLWGVGQWTADMISIFYFGEEDIWPDGDLAARKMLEQLTSRRRKTIRTAERFKPYRSYLALYMWEFQDVVTN